MHRFILLAVVALSAVEAAKQKYGAKGVLMCGDVPASGIMVKLIDEDTGSIDDPIDQGRTNDKGEFLLSGKAGDPLFTTIDPILKIYHKCNVGKLQLCDSKLKFRLPTAGYIDVEGKHFDFGVFNLETRMENQETDCLH